LSLSKGRIALLNCPYVLNEPFFQQMAPLSLLYLGAYLEKIGHDVKIFNLDKNMQVDGAYLFTFNLPKLLEELNTFAPDMIGVTCPYSGRWPFAGRMVQWVKNYFPTIPVAIGGIHPTAFPEHCLSTSDADYVILGEGEHSTGQLLDCILGGNDVNDIDGVAFKENGEIKVNVKTHFIDNLDELPFPAYHLLDMDEMKQQCAKDRISRLKGLYFPLLTSRSCPNQCTYCNMFLAHGRKWRARSAENVLAEIQYLVDEYGINQFAIVDDNFSFSHKRTKAILSGIIERGLSIRFITPNGLSVKTLDDELVGLLKAAGALEISIAIESGSEWIREKVYNKRINTQKIHEVVEACRKHGLPIQAFYMIGAPGETDDTVQESLDLMRLLRVPSYINITTPYKGTKLYEDYLALGKVTERDFIDGGAIDLRLPMENVENYDQILRWRRKAQIWNIIFSWKDILKNPGFLNINAISRFAKGILFSKKIDRYVIEKILSEHFTLPG